MTQMTTLTSLPNEILEAIFAQVHDAEDISALIFSSRRFWLLADPDDFSHVSIGSYANTLAFHQALRTKPQRAAVVRSLVVDRGSDWHEGLSATEWDSDGNFDPLHGDYRKWDGSSTELSLLPRLRNLVLYRVRNVMPNPPDVLQGILTRAVHETCLMSLKICEYAEHIFLTIIPFGDRICCSYLLLCLKHLD